MNMYFVVWLIIGAAFAAWAVATAWSLRRFETTSFRVGENVVTWNSTFFRHKVESTLMEGPRVFWLKRSADRFFFAECEGIRLVGELRGEHEAIGKYSWRLGK